MDYDYGERAKAERTLGLEEKVVPPAKPAGIRRGELQNDRIADGIPAFNWPGVTRLFNDYGEPAGDVSEGVYRLLSAYAHSRRWRLLLGPSTPIGAATAQGQLMSVSANDDLASMMTSLAVSWMARAIEEAGRYCQIRGT